MPGPYDTMRKRFVSFLFATLGLALIACPAHGDLLRTQTIQLQEGWNSIYLEVSPSDVEPSVVFSNTPIDIVASYYETASSAQFVQDPEAELFRQTGWGVWYADDRPDSFLSTLHAIYGQQAYLIHSLEAHTWSVRGTVRIPDNRWRPGSYNFVGFSVDSVAAPTYAQFFAGSDEHDMEKIYRLINGSWKKVMDANGETMRAGEAFWIYCEGSSSYKGPLQVDAPSTYGLLSMGGRMELILRNKTGHPITPTLAHVVSSGDPVPLSVVIQSVGDPAQPVKDVAIPFPDGDWTQPLPTIETGIAMRVPFAVRSEDMTSAAQSSLIKVTTDLGTVDWIPVMGLRDDLEEN